MIQDQSLLNPNLVLFDAVHGLISIVGLKVFKVGANLVLTIDSPGEILSLDYFRPGYLRYNSFMQIFIPYPTFDDSVKCLDKRRLQKQNLETTQILDAILNLPTKSGKERKGWLNHPALVMWKNHPGALTDYLERGIVECNSRGIKTDYVQDRLNLYRSLNACQDRTLPIWWGDIKVHNSHKSRLLQKGFEELFKKQKTAQNTKS